MQNVDYDKKIGDFIEEWETDKDNFNRMIKRAVTGLMVPLIYKNIRETILLEKPIPLKSNAAIIRRCPELLTKSIWYICWIIKWIIFKSHLTGKNLVLTSFFQRSKNSLLKKLFPIKNNQIFINFGIVFNFKLFLNPAFLCYPHFIFKHRYLSKLDLEIEKFFLKLFKKYFSIKFDYRIELIHSLNSTISLYLAFHDLIHKLKKENNIDYLVQDCDYLAERVIFAGICNEHKITTISADHSILLKDHLYKECHSDIVLAWGEHQRNRINRLSRNKPAQVIITGNDNKPEVENSHQKSIVTWVYFLPAFQEAHIQSVYRSLGDSIKRIDEIVELIKSKFNNKINFLVKPHPSDQSGIFPLKLNLTNEPLKIILKKIDLAFVEDSTVSIELLSTKVPVIYFADRLDNDPLAIKKLSIGYEFSCHGDRISNILSRVPHSFSSKKREKVYEYYFANQVVSNDLIITHIFK